MDIELSSGAIKDIFCGEEVKNPTLQILKIKEEKERYRLLISDGTYMTGSILSNRAYLLIEPISEYDVISLHRYSITNVKEKKILIIFEASLLARGNKLGGKIGEPDLYGEGNASLPNSQVSLFSCSQSSSSSLGSSNDEISSSQDIFLTQEKVKVPTKAGVHPISALVPYSPNKWTICTRVTNKSEIIEYKKQNRSGRYFFLHLCDNSGEIRGVAFDQDCDRLHESFIIGKAYYIKGLSVQLAKKSSSALNNNYEITFNSYTQVTYCYDDSGIPNLKYNFVPIGQLHTVDVDELVDVIGICKYLDEEVSTVLGRTDGNQHVKRDIYISDSPDSEVRVTLWGSTAENFTYSPDVVVSVKGVRVSSYGGRSLSVLGTSLVQINPDIDEAHTIRKWYRNINAPLSSSPKRQKTITSFFGSKPKYNALGADLKTIREAYYENYTDFKGENYYCTKAAVSFINYENCLYPACPKDGCRKKIQENDGIYHCVKCNRNYDDFEWKFIIQKAMLSDLLEDVDVTFFNNGAEILLGRSAEELAAIRDTEEYALIFSKAMFGEFIFKLKVYQEIYNEEARLRTIVNTISPLDVVEYTKFLLSDIQNMLKGRTS